MAESKREAKAEKPEGPDKAALLAEAYKRDILPPDMKTAYEEAMRRGLVEGVNKPVDVLGEVGAVGAGGVRGVANIAGLPVDAVNALLNLGGLGTAKPVGGSEWWKDRAADVVDVGNRAAGIEGDGRAVIDAKAQTPIGRLGARAAEEVGASLLPMAGAIRLGAGAVRAAPSVRGSVVDALGGTSAGDRAAQLVASAGTGLGAGIAQEAGPQSAPALAGVVGGGVGAYAGQRAGAAYAPGGLGRLLGGVAGMAAGGYAGSQAPENAQVAEFAGSLLGGAATVPGLYAAGQVRNFAAPLMSPGARKDAAGSTLRHFATNADALAGAPDEIVPGSALTTAQAAADPGLASLERTLRSQQETGPLFAMRDAERAAAQRRNMQRLAPSGGGAEDVAAMVQGRLAQFQRRGDIRETLAQNVVDQRVGALGPGVGPVEAGAVIREDLGAAQQGAMLRASNLWKQLDDRPDLALEVPGTREAALRMRAEITEDTGAPAPFVQQILDRAADWPEIARYKNVSEFRKRLTNAQSALQRSADPTAPTDLRRVTAVLRGLDDDIASAAQGAVRGAAGDTPSPDAGPAPSAPSRPGGGVPGLAELAAGRPGPQNVGAVFTPDGQRIETEWRLVDLAGPDAPIVSHTQDFRPNPNYPAALQPRNRDRAASEAQIVRMAGELNPERLGAGGVGDGAPIIGQDRVTESGNGRLLAIDRAYSNGGRSAEQYRAWVEGQGFDTSGMQRPALVRVRTNELNDADRVRWTEGANAGPGLKLSPVEQAAVDARRVGDDTLSLYRGGALDDAANVDFARAFVRQAAPGDAGTLSTADGRLSLEGVRRMQAAMLAKTYGDAPIVQTLLETGDDDIKALGRALADTAPMMAQLRAAIARGDVPGQFDPVATLTDAARVVQRARRDGVPIGDVLAQTDAFNPVDRNAAGFLSAAYGDGFRRVSYGRAVEALRTYADEAMRQTGGDMFGPGPAAGDVWAAAERRARGIGDDTAAGAGSPASAAGSGGGGAAGAGGAVPPGGGGGGGGGGGSVVGDGLTPNFGPDDRALYASARTATREMKETFGRGAPGQVLKQGGFNARGEAGYAMPVEQVAAKFFNAGKTSATDLAEFLRAAEGRAAATQALRDYAIGDLRRVAVDDAGRVDPKKWGAWVAKHNQALTAFPDLRREFSNVAAAQRSVDRVTALRDQAVAGFKKSAAGKFTDGRDADAAFASVINSGNRTQGLTQLVRMAKGDADKLGQLRRAAVDNLMRTIENTGSVDALQNQSLSPAKTVRYMATNGKALQKSGLLTPGQIAVLRRVEEDMNRAVYVQTVGKAVGSNTYQNFAAGAVLGQLSMGYARHNGLLANTIGRAGNWIYKIADRDVQKLVADAMLDPALARELMARATPDRMLWVNGMLKRRAVATGLISAATADGEP